MAVMGLGGSTQVPMSIVALVPPVLLHTAQVLCNEHRLYIPGDMFVLFFLLLHYLQPRVGLIKDMAVTTAKRVYQGKTIQEQH